MVIFSDSQELRPAGCHKRTLRLIRINVDEAHQHTGIGLPALHVDGIVDHAFAIRQMAAVTAGESAGDLDILDGVVIGIAKRQRDQGFRA